MTKKGRAKRIILGFLLPLIVATFLFFVWGISEEVFIDGENIKDVMKFDKELPVFLSALKAVVLHIIAILISTLYAAFACGIQSVLFSFLVEYVVNPKIENILIVLFICGTLGLISGIIANQLVAFTELIPIGAITGVIVGKILRDSYNRSPEIES